MKKLIPFFFILSLCLHLNSLHGNNIQITNVSLEGQEYIDQYVFVEFDLSWENSWRTSAIPLNHDAAWLFVKYRLANQEWHHMLLRQTDYFAPTGSTIQVSPDSAGVMIYRDADGSGTVSWENIRFRWDYGEAGIANDALVEVHVYGIEMVYILQEPFYVGDDSAAYCFHQGSTSYEPYHITSDGSIIIGNNATTELWAWAGGITSGNLASEYPVGYNAFYCMKYEASQEQYMEFLNSLNRAQQNERTETDISGTTITNIFVMTGTTSMQYRNSIRCNTTLNASDPVTFYCDYNTDGVPNDVYDGQNIACNSISWPDMAAYLDWSGLRPLTELEFEKACRGPNQPVKGEYAWGSTDIYASAYSLTDPGTPNELIDNMAVNSGNCFYSSTLLGLPLTDEGPLRCGIFAASSVNHTRVETGAGYYGVMELSGNLSELIVDIYDLAGRSFTGIHGDGILDNSGYANTDHWPGINGNNSFSAPNGIYGGTAGVTGVGGIGRRGGEFISSYETQTSYRGGITTSSGGFNYTLRIEYMGIRGCRAAW